MKALDGEKECTDILHTVAACGGSFNSLMAEIFESHIRFHVLNPDEDPRSADRHLPLTYKDLFTSKCKIMELAPSLIDEIAERVGLTKELLATPVGHLPGGKFQRGLVGFALIGEPNVLLL